MFPHQSSDSTVDPRLSVFVLAVLCGINLFIARSNSEVIFSHS